MGVNKYQSDEMQDVEVFKVNPESERVAIERVRALRANRDRAKWEAAMAEVHRAIERFKAGEAGGLIPAMVEASDADATTGELMGALKQHLGWAPPH